MAQEAKFELKTNFKTEGISAFYKVKKGASYTERKLINNGCKVTLEPIKGENKMIIEIERNGRARNSKEEFYIDICSPKGIDYSLTKTKDKCEIELKPLPPDWAAQGTNVTVGDGKPG